MKISVLIPAYNEEKLIAAAIRSVHAQDYSDFEIIVVNNNSRDRTAEIAKEEGVVVIDESRAGTMWACEAGRKAAHGEIIVRMDADCSPRGNWLSQGATYFEDLDVVAASGPYEYVDAPFVFRTCARYFQRYVYFIFNHILRLTGSGGVMVGGNSFFRADVLEKSGGFNTSITFYGDDTDAAKRMSMHGKVIFTSRLTMPTSARRFRNEGMAKITFRYLFHFFKIVFSKVSGD